MWRRNSTDSLRAASLALTVIVSVLSPWFAVICRQHSEVRPLPSKRPQPWTEFSAVSATSPKCSPLVSIALRVDMFIHFSVVLSVWLCPHEEQKAHLASKSLLLSCTAVMNLQGTTGSFSERTRCSAAEAKEMVMGMGETNGLLQAMVVVSCSCCFAAIWLVWLETDPDNSCEKWIWIVKFVMSCGILFPTKIANFPLCLEYCDLTPICTKESSYKTPSLFTASRTSQLYICSYVAPGDCPSTDRSTWLPGESKPPMSDMLPAAKLGGCMREAEKGSVARFIATAGTLEATLGGG
mmetsp:Transcript_21313/g.48121  ORF Transcript_21313/g.48121 Transcript_21313/m.48121 type:complete len:295 (+) Transcript_21313:957-1841(+)